MSYLFKWSISAEVDGESVAHTGTIEATGRDHVRVTIPSGVSQPPEDAGDATAPDAGAASPPEHTVEIQPGTERLVLLIITASEYGKELTYTIEGGTQRIILDAPQMFVGEGGFGLLDSPPRTLKFTNGLANDVTITILVGRNAAVA